VLATTQRAIPACIAAHISCAGWLWVRTGGETRTGSAEATRTVKMMATANLASFATCAVAMAGSNRCPAEWPSREALWHLVTGACFASNVVVESFCFLGGLTHRQHALFQLLGVEVNGMVCVTYLLIGLGVVETSRVDVFGRPFCLPRYVSMAHTTPLMIMTLAHMGSPPLKVVLQCQTAMIVAIACGWIASDADWHPDPEHPLPQVVLFIVASVAAFVYATLGLVAALAEPPEALLRRRGGVFSSSSSGASSAASSSATPRRSRGDDDDDPLQSVYAGSSHDERLRLVKLVLVWWYVYPVIWLSSALGVISPEVELPCYIFAEIVAKLVCTAGLLHGAVLTCVEAAAFASRLDKWRVSEALRQESMFISYVFHELRNPYNGIAGHIHFIERELGAALDCLGPSDEPREDDEGRIRATVRRLRDALDDAAAAQLCSQHMSDVLNNVLDLKKIEDGSIQLALGPVDLDALARDLVTMLDLPDAPFEMRYVRVARDPDWTVLADATRLRQILLNFLVNAKDHTQAGFVELRLVEEAASAGDQLAVRFEVRDTGPGLDARSVAARSVAADSASAGDGAWHASRVATGDSRAEGLGLAVAAKLVRLMSDDTIHVVSPWSEDGRSGSSFYFTVAFARPARRDRSPRTPAAQPQQQPRDDETVATLMPRRLACLLVDDLAFNHRVLERALTKMTPFDALDWSVDVAWTAEEAIARVVDKSERYDLIFMDEHFDSTHGVILGSDAIRAIREAPSPARRPIVISASGNCTQEDADFYRAAGADDALGKPIPFKFSLARRLLLLIERHRPDLSPDAPDRRDDPRPEPPRTPAYAAHRRRVG